MITEGNYEWVLLFDNKFQELRNVTKTDVCKDTYEDVVGLVDYQFMISCFGLLAVFDRFYR